jgi:hypothetical protein
MIFIIHIPCSSAGLVGHDMLLCIVLGNARYPDLSKTDQIVQNYILCRCFMPSMYNKFDYYSAKGQ